jgi:hypothetical protein
VGDGSPSPETIRRKEKRYREVVLSREPHRRAYSMVGMTNSAPVRIPVGQRDVIVFIWV